jgi:cytochrome c553
MANRFRLHLSGSFAVLAALCVTAIAAWPLQAQGPAPAQPAPHPLPWAYAVFDPEPPGPPPDDTTPLHVPGSTQAFTMKQIRDTANPVDWFPQDHPSMPTIVAHRRSPNMNPWIGSCGLCHLPNGKGRPENAGIAGLPAGYILEQLADFKAGARKTADPGKKNTAVMTGNAGGITDQEAKDAAAYFASMKYTPWIKVVEVEKVPKVKNVGGFFVPIEGSDAEPIGNRILIPSSPRSIATRAPVGSRTPRWGASRGARTWSSAAATERRSRARPATAKVSRATEISRRSRDVRPAISRASSTIFNASLATARGRS